MNRSRLSQRRGQNAPGIEMIVQRCAQRKRVALHAILPLLAIMCATLCAPASARADKIERTAVFESGREGYHAFRIPSVIVTPGGTLLALCEGRKSSLSDHGDIDLVCKTSVDAGRTWSPLRVVYEEGGDAKTTIGNPCPVVDASTKTLWLPFCRDNDRVFVTSSKDDGQTWSKPREITPDVKRPGWTWYATGPGIGIQLTQGAHKGRLLIPCDHRETIDGQVVMLSHVFYSDDAGQSWTLGQSVGKHTDECQLAELSDGTVQINMRNYWERTGKQPVKGGMRAIAHSRDGGETWSPLTFDAALIEPVCQASLLRLPAANDDAGGLLFSNPASKKDRRKLTVRLSRDDGKTWPVSRVLHEGPSAYSCLTVLPDRTVGCLFEAGEKTAYERIDFARFELSWLAEATAKASGANPAAPMAVPTRPEEIPRVPPVEPDAALASFRVLGGFRMEQLAAEPLVNDPVDMAYDENGLAYVVEMRDYPFPEKADEPPTQFLSRVRILEDTDGDGRFDRSDVFVDGLNWATSVALWKGGAFVAAAPDIWYFRDTDGDRRADVRQRVLSGFGRRNVQAIMNNLRWGLDQRIYGAASGNGGLVQMLEEGCGPHRAAREAGNAGAQSEKPSSTGAQQAAARPPVSLSQRDFRFDPRTGCIEAISGGARFGNTFDDWGNRFVCNIRNPAQHVVLPAHYLARNRHLPVPEVMHDVAQSGDQIPVYRISPVEPWRELRARRWVQERVNYPRSELVGAGFFTSSSGVTIYRGDAYPESYRGNIFVADVAGNLVHRQAVTPDGVTFTSRRADEGEAEFVSSTDIWFRPVNFINAPDGTLHVLDMYRETIEHPWSIPDDIKAMLDLGSGNDRGRIYRLAPPNFQPRPAPKLGNATTEELVALLEHPNAWHRETASRLLFERQDYDNAYVPLREILEESPSPVARLSALYVLRGLPPTADRELLTGLNDPAPEVREHAVRLSEAVLWHEEFDRVRERVLALADDPAQRVRFQVAFSLGRIRDASLVDAAVTALAKIARRDAGDYWMRMAVLSSAGETADRLLAELLAEPAKSFDDPAGGAELLARLATTVGARGQEEEIARVLDAIARLSQTEAQRDLALSLAAGLGEGLARSGKTLRSVAESAAPETSAGIRELLENASRIAVDVSVDAQQRVRAVDLLRQSAYAPTSAVVGELLSPKHPQAVQLAAVRALASFGDSHAAKVLLDRWKQLTPPVRSEVVEALLSRSIWIAPFLDAVEAGVVEPTQVPTPRRGQLLANSDASIRARAEKIFGPSQPGARADVVARYRAALDAAGTAARGREVFRRECLQCHRVGNEGHDVGPDLATIRHRSPEEILIHILDPNREVAPNYMSYVVVLKDGRTLTGTIATETSASLTLKRAENATDTVLRDDVDEIACTGKSIMPEGVEQKIDPAQMADLIAFLLRPE